jgi:septal ring factor EnvC (AmiA/AmiB activator)
MWPELELTPIVVAVIGVVGVCIGAWMSRRRVKHIAEVTAFQALATLQKNEHDDRDRFRQTIIEDNRNLAKQIDLLRSQLAEILKELAECEKKYAEANADVLIHKAKVEMLEGHIADLKKQIKTLQDETTSLHPAH